MAIVGTIYTTLPRIRTPDEVIESLFRDPRDPPVKSGRSPSDVKPEYKRLKASLSIPLADDESRSGTAETFEWLAHQLKQRRASQKVPFVVLMDGQESF